MRTLGQELIERGKIEGRIEGRIEGQLQALRKFLTVRFGPLTPEIELKLMDSGRSDVLDRLAAIAASATNLRDFAQALP